LARKRILDLEGDTQMPDTRQHVAVRPR